MKTKRSHLSVTQINHAFDWFELLTFSHLIGFDHGKPFWSQVNMPSAVIVNFVIFDWFVVLEAI